MESRAELRCRSDLLAKCHWISLYPTPNTERTERWSAGRQVMSSAHFMIDTAQLSELNFHLCAKSSLACWRLNESFILSSYKLQLDSPWTFFFLSAASHLPLCPLIFYSNLNSRSANIEGHLFSPDHHFGLPSCSNVWIFSGMKNLLETPTVIFLALLTRPLH